MAQRLKDMMADDMKSALGDVQSCLIVDYTGLTANEANEFRSVLRARAMKMRVIHNRLAGRALGEMGMGDAKDLLAGPCALVYGGKDPVVLCRTVRDWIKEKQKLQVRGGLLDRKCITPDDVERLSKVPPVAELYARFAGLLVAPMVRLAGGVQSVYQKIGIALEEVRKQKEKAAGAAPAQS